MLTCIIDLHQQYAEENPDDFADAADDADEYAEGG